MYMDQFSDTGLSLLGELVETHTRDKISAAGQVFVTDYRRGGFHPGVLMQEIVKTAAHVFAGPNPFYSGILAVSGEGSSPDMCMDAVCRAHLNEMRDIYRTVRSTPSHPFFRQYVREGIPCVEDASGVFPVSSPLQTLLSMIYAGAQGVPDRTMSGFNAPMIKMFGPKTFGRIKMLIAENPGKQILDASNVSNYSESIDDGYPAVQTFIPRLVFEVLKANTELKGELDSLVKMLSVKLKDERVITTADRDFQRQVLDILEGSAGKEDIFRILSKHPRDMVFNTTLGKEAPGIKKVRNILIDTGKLNVPYNAGVTSLSPQVAEVIYNDERTAVDFNHLATLIERLEDLKVDDEERKEINDRLLGPLKLFFEPADAIVDKIMVTR
jgi:hypothetical protein